MQDHRCNLIEEKGPPTYAHTPLLYSSNFIAHNMSLFLPGYIYNEVLSSPDASGTVYPAPI